MTMYEVHVDIGDDIQRVKCTHVEVRDGGTLCVYKGGYLVAGYAKYEHWHLSGPINDTDHNAVRERLEDLLDTSQTGG